MTGSWGRWLIWGTASAIRRWAMSCNATLCRPRPERKRTTTWPAFIRIHLALLAATDFLTAEVLMPHGLVTYYVLFFIHLESRRVDIAGITVHPDEWWMQPIARNVTMEGCGALRDCRYLLHDRDAKYTQSFRAIIASGRVEPLALPAQPELECLCGALGQVGEGGVLVQGDPTALRVVQSYGSFLSRQGNTADAMKVFAAFDEALPRHPLIVEATNELKAGKLPLMVDTPQAGAAEVLYGLGASLGRLGGEDLGLIYLQLSLYLAPSHPLALLSLGDLYEAMKKPEFANKAYERVLLNSPLHRNAQIQLALNLDSLDRTDEAKASLEKLIAANPGDLEAIMALGNVLRGRKQFAECADVYSKGVDTISKPEKSNWVIYYFRGICF